MALDEFADRLGGEHHHAHRQHDGDDHHRHLVGQADGGDHRVEREDDVDDGDLHQHATEAGHRAAGRPFLVGAFERAVDLVHALPQQEQPAEDQDQVAAGDLLHEREQRLGQPHDPGERQQQQDARQHRQQQPQPPCQRAARLGKAPDQDRDEDDVVDAEHDLQRRQGRERDPGVGVGEPVEHRITSRRRPAGRPCPPAAAPMRAACGRVRPDRSAWRRGRSSRRRSIPACLPPSRPPSSR
jgi:hypothetical protein